MARIWSYIKVGDKRTRETVVEATDLALWPLLEQVCALLDIPHPVLLGKHEREFNRFGKTRFREDDFIDEVPFTVFEVELLKDKKKPGAQNRA